jgi:hypothetical protein
LAKIVKSFAGAGIVNKVIAIFGNDTVAHEPPRPGKPDYPLK